MELVKKARKGLKCAAYFHFLDVYISKSQRETFAIELICLIAFFCTYLLLWFKSQGWAEMCLQTVL